MDLLVLIIFLVAICFPFYVFSLLIKRRSSVKAGQKDLIDQGFEKIDETEIKKRFFFEKDKKGLFEEKIYEHKKWETYRGIYIKMKAPGALLRIDPKPENQLANKLHEKLSKVGYAMFKNMEALELHDPNLSQKWDLSIQKNASEAEKEAARKFFKNNAQHFSQLDLVWAEFKEDKLKVHINRLVWTQKMAQHIEPMLNILGQIKT